MKEREYINVRDLSRIVAAENLLRDLVVASSIQPITKKDYSTVMRILDTWREALFDQINADSEP